MPLKPLNFPFMLLSCPAGTKGAQVAAMAAVGVGFAGVKPIFAGFEFANHKASDYRENCNRNAARQVCEQFLWGSGV
jgi:hypothetical protein